MPTKQVKRFLTLMRRYKKSIWSKDSSKKADSFKKAFNNVVEWESEDRMVHPINNWNGGEGEVKQLRKKLEDCIKKRFSPLKVPVALACSQYLPAQY